MRPDRASFTARFVAACRGLGAALPEGARLVDDPYGAGLAHPAAGAVARGMAALPSPLRAAAWAPLLPLLPWAVYMQVRTRALDDELLAFARGGGGQAVILGAGLDARAARLAGELAGVAVYEVDHPATQAEKRRALEREGVRSAARYLAWDFERDPLPELPGRLAALGHDPARPTFTLWEGVTMYLTLDAIDATLAAVRAYGAPGSRLAFNYLDRAVVDGGGAAARAVRAAVGAVGEPFRTGFDPRELRAWLTLRGFTVERDRSFGELAEAMLPAPWPRAVRVHGRLAVLERCATASPR